MSSVHTTIENVIVTRNVAANGGGMAVRMGEVIVLDSNYEMNSASISGGGISLQAKAIARFSNVQIQQNTVSKGNAGGLYVENSVKVEMMMCACSLNRAPRGFGGALFIGNSKNVSLVHTRISENTALSGGGIMITDGSSVTFKGSNNVKDLHADANNDDFKSTWRATAQSMQSLPVSGTVEKNKANVGGGIVVNGHSKVSILAYVLSSNSASFDGGGLLIEKCKEIHLFESTLVSNSAASRGGGLYLGKDVSIIATGNLIKDNWAGGNGGGLHQGLGAELDLLTSYIVGNKALGNGGGIFVSDTVLNVKNSKIWYNSVRNGLGGGMFLERNGIINCDQCDLSRNAIMKTGRGGGFAIRNQGRLHLSYSKSNS